MKIYISADIEGVAGIANWDETSRTKSDYPFFKTEMINEVRAACEGANLAGAKEIWIKDAHASGRNLELDQLPLNTRLIRVFNGHPFGMMQELDDTFDAVVMIGYHSYADSDHNPLAHTLSGALAYLKINGQYASEFLVNTYTASSVDVPVVFVSGDIGLCEHIKQINSRIITVGLNQGRGKSVISIHPQVAFTQIKEGVQQALQGDYAQWQTPLPQSFEVELSFNEHIKSYRAAFYPGMKRVSTRNLRFETDDYFEVLRMLSFIM